MDLEFSFNCGMLGVSRKFSLLSPPLSVALQQAEQMHGLFFSQRQLNTGSRDVLCFNKCNWQRWGVATFLVKWIRDGGEEEGKLSGTKHPLMRTQQVYVTPSFWVTTTSKTLVPFSLSCQRYLLPPSELPTTVPPQGAKSSSFSLV